MKNIQAKLTEKINGSILANFLTLSLIAAFLPFFVHNQWVTGPVVNAILILLLFLAGFRAAVVVSLIPSLMALSGGLLPAVLAPVVPFIMISNVILVLSVNLIYEKIKDNVKGYWLGVFTGAGLKFIFLHSSITVITGLLTKRELAAKVAQMMSWPQFATAVLGGIIAWGILRGFKRV